MDLLFIIFLAVVAAGFAIILCVVCYCSCCHPLTSYSSSSSYHRERSHGEYKSDGTTKSSKSFEYDKHHWDSRDSNRSASTSPLITDQHHQSTSSLSQYPTRPSPIGFEHVAKTKTENKQTLSSTRNTSAGTPPYPVNQKIVHEKSNRTMVTTYPAQTDSTYPHNQQPHHMIDSPYPTNQQTHQKIVTSYQYPSNQQSYQTVVQSSPSNKQNQSSDFETNSISYSTTPATLHPVHPSDSRIANQTIYYTRSADPSTQSSAAQPSDSRLTTQTTHYTKTSEKPHHVPMVQSNVADSSDSRRRTTQTTYYTDRAEPYSSPAADSSSKVTTQTSYYIRPADPYHRAQTSSAHPSDSRVTTQNVTYYTEGADPHPHAQIVSAQEPSDYRVTTQTTYYTKTADPRSPSVQSNLIHPSDSRITSQTITNPMAHTTQIISTYPANKPNNLSSQPLKPTETSSSTKTTYVVESQRLPSDTSTIHINKNVYSDNQQIHATYPDVVNESHKSGRYITRHPSTGSLYDNM